MAALAGVSDTHVAVPIQGSGTFAVEAAIGSLVPRDGRLLVLVNGSYGRRIAAMAGRLGRLGGVLEAAENQVIDPARSPLRWRTTLPSPTWRWCIAKPPAGC